MGTRRRRKRSSRASRREKVVVTLLQTCVLLYTFLPLSLERRRCYGSIHSVLRALAIYVVADICLPNHGNSRSRWARCNEDSHLFEYLCMDTESCAVGRPPSHIVAQTLLRLIYEGHILLLPKIGPNLNPMHGPHTDNMEQAPTNVLKSSGYTCSR